MKLITRERKFFLLRWIVLPAAVLFYRLLSSTYRLNEEQLAQARLLVSQEPVLFVATYHGHLAALIPFARVAHRAGRPLVIMTSPSRDGRLLDLVLGKFRINTVKGSSASKAVSGAAAMIAAVKKGAIAIHALDGPRGPICIPKPGTLRIPEAADASCVLLGVSASSAFKTKSWDRLFIPKPFARISIDLQDFARLPGEDDDAALERLRLELIEQARRLNSPVIEGLQ